jgi:hypothetical protein
MINLPPKQEASMSDIRDDAAWRINVWLGDTKGNPHGIWYFLYQELMWIDHENGRPLPEYNTWRFQ